MNNKTKSLQIKVDDLVTRLEQVSNNGNEEISKIKEDIIKLKGVLVTEKMIREELKKVKLRLAHLNAKCDNPLYASEYNHLKLQEQILRRKLVSKKMESKKEGRNI